MLYSILRLIIGSGLRLYFRRIETQGLQRLEGSGPLIIIANHTNALTDPLLLGVLLKRRIHFFVRGDVFENKLARALFTHLGMMPVYRLQDGREKLSGNEASNRQAIQILKEGGALLIFAEGSSNEQKVMRPVKKGPFRLAVEAAQTLPVPPPIVPLGINYLEPEQAGTTAWLLAGPPLSWPENIPAGENARLSLALMQNATLAFPPLTLHAGTAERAAIAETLLLLCKNTKSRQQGKEGYFSFKVAQQLLQRLALLPHTEFVDLCKKAKAYEVLQQQLGLKENAFKKSPAAELWTSAVLGAAVWLPALIFHWPVTALSRYIVQRTVKSPDFISSIHVLSLTFLNLIWYSLALVLLSVLWSFTGALLLLLALACCGIVAHTVLLPALHQLRQQLRLGRLAKTRKEPFIKLLSLRQELIAWLSAAD